jgi:hypothetical protein
MKIIQGTNNNQVVRNFNLKILEGLELLKSFNDSASVNHLVINGIDISKFTVPKFQEGGKFLGGPTAYRNEYEIYIQKHLKGIYNPCLYLFEIIEPDTKKIFKAYKLFSDKQDKVEGAERRSCSAIRQNFNLDFDSAALKVLYIGKSEKPIDGRVVVHFGYYEKGVAGLQLVYWAKDIGLKLNLHVFELGQELQPYLEVLEKLLFVQLKPVIGKR